MRSWCAWTAVLAVPVTLSFVGCSSTSSGGDATPAPLPQSTAAAVSGAADAHCQGMPTVVVDSAMCSGSGGSGDAGGMGGSGGGDSGGSGGGDSGGSGGSEAGGGAATGGSSGDCPSTDPDYGDIQYGSESDDDDCKYHVKWTSSAVSENQNVTLSVTVTHKSDGSAVTGAAPRAEIFFPCDPSHPAPGLDYSAAATEMSGGTYTIGPVQFDKPGHWGVRFHVFETCDDSPQSPHGHAAFYLNVP